MPSPMACGYEDALPTDELNDHVVEWLGDSMAQGRLDRVARRMIGPGLAQEREDLVNTAMVRAISRSSTVYSTNDRAMDLWFRRILRNTMLDHLRRRRRGVRELPCDDVESAPDPALSIEERVEAMATERRLLRCIEDLPPKQRSVIHLFVCEGLSRGEIASALKMRPEAVSMARTRAIRNLRVSMSREDESPFERLCPHHPGGGNDSNRESRL